MRKIILYINSTLNSIVTGDPKADKTNFMVWTTNGSVETGSVVILKTMQTVDTLLFGRATYEDLNRKWPFIKDWGPQSETVNQLGEKINNAHKWVVTSRDDQLVWGDFEAPERITRNDIEQQIRERKQGNGGDILIIGSPTLVRSLTKAKLIDEYQIDVRPVVVNVGEQLFEGMQERIDFELVQVQPLADGSMIVTYKLAQA
jgi:dihydrofolate reductase